MSTSESALVAQPVSSHDLAEMFDLLFGEGVTPGHSGEHNPLLLPLGGSAQSPGFWANHIEIYDQELFQYDPVQFGDPNLSPPPYHASDQLYEDVFGVTLLFDGIEYQPTDPTLEDALNTGGGGEAALIRHSAGALANAASDDLNFTFADIAAGAVRDTLMLIDVDNNTILSPDEIINVVQDLYTVGTAPLLGTDNFDFDGTGGLRDVNDVVDALSAMANLPDLLQEDFF